jgi:hypothetical protein
MASGMASGMADVARVGDELVVTLTAFEKAEAIHGDVHVPASAVRGVEVVDDIVHEVHGLKLPGSRWPGKFAVGTFVELHGPKSFVVIHHDNPRGVRIALEGAQFDQLLVGCDDPERIAIEWS